MKINQDANTHPLVYFSDKRHHLEFEYIFKDGYLTKREKEVLHYIILGYTAKRIARALGISFRTVENYINILKYKFRCDAKSELIEWVIKSGFVYQLNLFNSKSE